MPDITLCAQKECPVAAECYRYRAVPDEHWQSWIVFQPLGCTAFEPIEGRRVRTMQEIERSRA